MATLATPSSTSSQAALARQARALFLAKATEVLNAVELSVRGRLNALVDQSANARESQDRRDAWLAYQKNAGVWVSTVTQAWKKAMAAPTTSQQTMGAGLSFELMGDDIVENKILASRLALRILDKASWELNDLSLRVRALENLTELDKQDLLRPEACAQCVVESWLSSGMDRAAYVAVQDIMHATFGLRMVEAYHDANDFLIKNGVMAEIDLRQQVKRTPSGPAGNTGAGALAAQNSQASDLGNDARNRMGHSTNSNLGAMPAGRSPMSAGVELKQGSGYGAVAQQLGSNAPARGAQQTARSNPAALNSRTAPTLQTPQGRQAVPSAGPAGQGAAAQLPRAGRAAVANYAEESEGETRMMTSATPLARAKMRAQGVMGQLKRMLTDKVMGFDDARTSAPSPQLAAALAQRIPSSVPSGHAPTLQGGFGGRGASGGASLRPMGGASAATAAIGGVAFAGFREDMRPDEAAGALREETTQLKKAASTSAEKATIEIVALMFQSILAEDRIPPAVRVWFARLQMPVLRLALSEPEFFGSLQHPARRLIDRMGSCVLGFEADVSSAALETEIKRVVQVIEQYPETGRRVFQLVYDEFQKFLSKFLTTGAATQRVVSVAQQMEQKETAAIQYTIEMRKMLGDMQMRDEIREFLFKVWAEVLAIASIKNGPQHADTLSLKQVAADLVWAASAKPDRADRAKVIQDLPNLLKRMRSGMALLNFDVPKQDEHIKVISDTLADAFMSRTETVDIGQIEAMSKRLKNLEDFISEDDVGDLPLDAESIELMLGIDISGIDIITAGGSDPTEAMRAWAMELEEGAWFNLDHNSKATRVQYAWRSKRGQLHLFAGTNGRTYLFQIRRLAAYMQAGLLSPIEDETLTVRATRNALAKLDANPERLLT